MTKRNARKARIVEVNTAKRKRKKRHQNRKLLPPPPPEPPPLPPPVLDPVTGAALPGPDSWHGSIDHNNLHCVPAGQLYARCGATAMRWLPPADFAPVCRICHKRTLTPPPPNALPPVPNRRRELDRERELKRKRLHPRSL